MSKRTTTNATEPSAPAPRRRKTTTTAEPAAAPKTSRSRRKTTAAVESAADFATATSDRPSYDEIATRAYFISLERGFSGDPLEHWLTAEQELRTSVGR